MTSIPHTAEREALASRIYDVVIYHYGSTYSWQGNVPGAYEEALARHRQSGVEQVAALLEPVGEGWVSVEERLPEALGKHGYTMTVLVAVTCGNGLNMVREDRYDHHSKTWEEFHTEYSYMVTHWRNLPEHPAASPKTNGGN